MDWLRLHHDVLTDPKWRVIARRSGQPLTTVLTVWLAMLVNASGAPKRGTLSGFTAEDIGAALDVDGSAIEAIYQAMQGKVLDGDRLTGWEKRQPLRNDNSLARVREHREKVRNAEKRSVTQCNADETGSTGNPVDAGPQALSDPDSETEILGAEETEFEEYQSDSGVKRGVTRCNAPDTDRDKSKKKKESPPSGGESIPPKPKPGDIAAEMVAAWNDELGGYLSLVQKIIPSRVVSLNARLHDTFNGEVERWRSFCRSIQGRSFMLGYNDQGWKADIDFVIKPANMVKILEGKYDDRTRHGRPQNGALSPEDGDAATRRAVSRILAANGTGGSGPAGG